MRFAAQLRGWLVWGLIATLFVYSASASVLRVLGPRHWHAAPQLQAQAPAAPARAMLGRLGQEIGSLLADAQAFSDAAHARAHALGAAPHHHHSTLLRHWHGADDGSVRVAAAEATDPHLADLKAAAAIGGATLLPLLDSLEVWQAPVRANGRWPQAGVQAWRNAPAAPPIEPPIA